MTLPHGSRLRAASVPPWEPAVAPPKRVFAPSLGVSLSDAPAAREAARSGPLDVADSRSAGHD